MSVMASQTTGVSIVYSTVCSGMDQREHLSSTSLAFVKGIHRWTLPLDDIIIWARSQWHPTYDLMRHVYWYDREVFTDKVAYTFTQTQQLLYTYFCKYDFVVLQCLVSENKP